MFLSKIKRWFKYWKPIHLCWLFEKYGIPIPKYLIGTTITFDQRNFIMADDDPSSANDPDSCTFDTENADRTAQPKSTPFHIRFQIAQEGPSDAGNQNFSIWYDKDGTPSTATQVTTTSAEVQLTESVGGAALADGDACDTRKCTAQAETWQDGSYLETSDETGKIDVDAGFYTEIQFCLQLLPAASGTYYFYCYTEGAVFTGTYDEVPEVTPAVSDENINVNEAPAAVDAVSPAMGDFEVSVADCPKPIDRVK